MPRKKSLAKLEQAVLDKVAVFDVYPDENINPYLGDRLAELVAAVRHIHEGRYGRCVDCDGDIPFARLQAKPEAIRCVSCQSRRDQSSVTYPTQMRSAS